MPHRSSSSSKRSLPRRLLALLVYAFYRNSARLAGWIGATGTTIVVRLSAFLLFCIGIQVMWNGAAELLGTLPLGTCRRQLNTAGPTAEHPTAEHRPGGCTLRRRPTTAAGSVQRTSG